MFQPAAAGGHIYLPARAAKRNRGAGNYRIGAGSVYLASHSGSENPTRPEIQKVSQIFFMNNPR
jgi:hypothetical protein